MKSAFTNLCNVLALGALTGALCITSALAQGHGSDPQTEKGVPERQSGPIRGPSYPLSTCVVDGKALTSKGGPVNVRHDHRLVRLCCEECAKEFEEDPKPHLAKLDEAVIAAQKGNYPLETCPVSGEELGAMGDPADITIGNRLVRLCCGMCAEKARERAGEVLDTIDEAVVAKQSASYPLETCVVSGEKLGSMGEPADYVHGTTLVRLCCPHCAPKLEKSPQVYLEKLEKAARTEGGGKSKGKTPSGKSAGGGGHGGSEAGTTRPGCCKG